MGQKADTLMASIKSTKKFLQAMLDYSKADQPASIVLWIHSGF